MGGAPRPGPGPWPGVAGSNPPLGDLLQRLDLHRTSLVWRIASGLDPLRERRDETTLTGTSGVCDAAVIMMLGEGTQDGLDYAVS